MSGQSTTGWITTGLLGLPLVGTLTLWSSLDFQPDPNVSYEAWSRFVTTDHYVLTHVFGSILGLILAIFGTFALGAYLPGGRAGRLGLTAMVVAILGSVLFLPAMGCLYSLPQSKDRRTWRASRSLPSSPTSSRTLCSR